MDHLSSKEKNELLLDYCKCSVGGVALIRTALKSGADPYYSNDDHSVIGLLLSSGASLAPLALTAWLESACPSAAQCAKLQVTLFAEEIEGVRPNRRYAVEFAEQLMERALLPVEQVWSCLFPDCRGRADTLSQAWRWEVLDRYVHRLPALLDHRVTIGNKQCGLFAAAMGHMDPLLFATCAAQWPGVNIDTWKEGLVEDREQAVKNFGPLLEHAYKEIQQAGINLQGHDCNGLGIGHHLLMEFPENIAEETLWAALSKLQSAEVDLSNPLPQGPGWAVAQRVETLLKRKHFKDEQKARDFLENERTHAHARALEIVKAIPLVAGKLRL